MLDIYQLGKTSYKIKLKTTHIGPLNSNILFHLLDNIERGYFFYNRFQEVFDLELGGHYQEN